MLIESDKKVTVGGLVGEEALKVGAGSGDVVYDQVEAQVEVAGDVGHVGPGAVGTLDGTVVDDGKAIVGGIGEEGQQVYHGDKVFELAAVKAV